MRLLVTGDRLWGREDVEGMTEQDIEGARRDWQFLWTILDGLYTDHAVGWLTVHVSPFVVISGMAPGADTHAANWVNNSPLHGEVVDLATFDYLTYDSPSGAPVALDAYPADWQTHGRAAGPIRNQKMLDSGVDKCVAFHHSLSMSKGTQDMVHRCVKAGVPVFNIRRIEADFF